MLKNWQSHQEYKTFLHEAKVHFDSSQRTRLSTELAPAMEKLRLLNLDPVMEYLLLLYPPFGRPAKNQPQVLRSVILFLLLLKDGLASTLTKWVNKLDHDPVLAALIGCAPDSLPPLGSYFDLMDRLWMAPASDRYSRSKLFAPDKNSRKPDKPDKKGQKAKERHKGIAKKIASRLQNGGDIPFNFERILQNILLIAAVRPSMQLGLIPSGNLTVSGDGTCVHTHASPFGKRFKNCRFQDGCPHRSSQCFRHYSDPDADWGWDSDLDDHFFGYSLYPLSFHNASDHTDLPLLFRFTNARRHDSVNFLAAIHEFRRHAPDISIHNICLDSANDNYGTYELLKNWGIRPFIDLNPQHGAPEGIPEIIHAAEDGTPICQAGYRMACWGYDKSKHSIKWRCPLAAKKVDSCACICSKSSYGRTVHTKTDWDIRLYTPVPRGTAEWKKIYNNRTASERINNRILNDYKLHSMRIHTKEHYSFMTMAICICIHMDAWYKKLLKTTAA